jgi:hypothetical protein
VTLLQATAIEIKLLGIGVLAIGILGLVGWFALTRKPHLT